MRLKSYRLDGNGKLIRLPEPPRHPNEREVVSSEEIFQIIWSLHCELGHAGKNRMFPVIGDRYYGITREEVRICIGTLEGSRRRVNRYFAVVCRSCG